MTIELDCPRCNRSLTLSDELAGQYAFCKYCEGRIWLPVETPSSSNTADAPVVVPPPMPTESPPLPGAKQPPQSPGSPSIADDKTSITDDKTTSLSHPPQLPPQCNTAEHSTATPPVPPSSGAPPKRSARRIAKLITAEPAQSRLEADPDGHLPELTLKAGEDNTDGKKTPKGSNEWLVLAIIIGSLIVSSAMLLLDVESTENSSSQRQERIYTTLKVKYFGPEAGPLLRYQKYLRDAALARSQGNPEQEARYYRKVLHLLNAQHLNKTDQGVTGLRKKSANYSLQSDDELMELLSALLKNSKQ